MNRPLLIAHRGDTTHFPENTIEAFQSAFELGADGIEFDVHMSDSGELIVVHDFIYDKSKSYPKLAEVLEKFSQSGRLEIEIKSLSLKCVEKMSELIDQYKPGDYEITSSILPLLTHVRVIMPSAKIGMIFNSNLLSSWMTPDIRMMFISGYLELTESNVLHMDLSTYTPEITKKLHEKGFVLHTHLSPINKEDIEMVKSLEIDQVTFDDINIVKLVNDSF